MAAADAEVDHLVRAFRLGVREVGDNQAAASMVTFVARRDAPDLSVLLVAAVRRLAGDGERQ
jgi:hypothetical protein